MGSLKYLLFIFVALIIAAGAYYFGKNGWSVNVSKPTPVAEASQTPQQNIVGGDKDEHGCIGSAGYSWCAAKNKCLRIWEETCDTAAESETLKSVIKTALIAKHGQNAAELNISVSKIEGFFAQGGASAQGGGGMWFAAKVNGEWKLVWDGNGTIQCSDLKDYPTFPTSMIPECLDTSTNKMVTR
jgi:hypothetical protein